MTKTMMRQNRTDTLPKGIKKSLEQEEVIAKMAMKFPEKDIEDIRNHRYERKKYVKRDGS